MGTPRDFLEGSDNPAKQTYQPRDFLEMEEPEESIGQAAKYAPFRIGEDLLNAGKGALESAPEYWEKAKTEVPAWLNPINGLRHPITRSKNVIAGLAELGHNTLNAPHGIANYLEKRLNLLPKGWADKIPYQEDISGALDQFTGKKMNPGDALTRGLVRNATSIIPAGKVAGVLNPMNLTAKSIAKDVLKTREKNIGQYGNRYENLWKEAESEGLSDLSHLTNKNDKTYYHGHHEPLKEIADESLLYPDSEFGKGFWTSTNKDVAQDYGKNVHETTGNYKIFNVNKSTDKELSDLYKNVQEKKLFHEGIPKTSRFPSEKEIHEANEAVTKFREALKNKGYEGIERIEYPSNDPEVMFFEKPNPSKNKIKIDVDTIKKYSPGRGIKGLEDFEANPTLQNAHNAKSDLLRIKRDLDKLTTLRTAERQQLGAVNNAIDSINNNMFRGPDGKIHEGMKQKYGEIQEGYRNEVVPYKNKAINEFMRGESSPDELVNSLSKRAFYAKRGKYHNAMRMRKLVKSHPYLAGIGTGSALGAGGLGLYEELFGKKK